jgi:hypothetical protein
MSQPSRTVSDSSGDFWIIIGCRSERVPSINIPLDESRQERAVYTEQRQAQIIFQNERDGDLNTTFQTKDDGPSGLTMNPYSYQTHQPQNLHTTRTGSQIDYGNNEYDHTTGIYKMGGQKGRQYHYDMTYNEDIMSGPIITIICDKYTTKKAHKPKKLGDCGWGGNPTTYNWSMDRETYFKLIEYLPRNF